MGWFNFLFRKRKEKLAIIEHIYAPLNGTIIEIAKIPDVMFSEKILGDGLAINPTSNQVLSPADGIITKTFPTSHAFGLTTTEGVELFVHFGIDSIELKGDGFQCLVHEGQKVSRGEPILLVDVDTVLQHTKYLITPIIISSTIDSITYVAHHDTEAVAGETIIMAVKVKR